MGNGIDAWHDKSTFIALGLYSKRTSRIGLEERKAGVRQNMEPLSFISSFF